MSGQTPITTNSPVQVPPGKVVLDGAARGAERGAPLNILEIAVQKKSRRAPDGYTTLFGKVAAAESDSQRAGLLAGINFSKSPLYSCRLQTQLRVIGTAGAVRTGR